MNRIFCWEFLIVVLTVVLGLFALHDDRPTYVDLETNVVQEPFVDGQSMLYRIKMIVTRNCTGSLRREIRQGSETFHLADKPFTWLPTDDWEQELSNSDGAGMALNFVIEVPTIGYRNTLATGLASYHVTQISQCNRIQVWFGHTITEHYPPVYFNIEKVN